MKKVICLFYTTLFVFIFTSCSVFLKGNELKTEIDDAITFANATPFNVLFSSKKGSITPNGNIQCKETQKISAYFSAGQDYYFKRWQVSLNKVVLTKEQAARYVDIYDYENPETTIKILKKVDNLSIDADCGDRPAAFEGFPRRESSGVNRDSRITVMFSEVMDVSSIHYSEEELQGLNVISKSESLADLINKATETSDHVASQTGQEILVDVKNKACYGYQSDPKNKETIVFKNIEIFKRITSENLLCCYRAPYFDQADGSILRIDTKKGEEAPAAYTEIVVKILPDMCIYDNNRQITLPGQFYWPYMTNTGKDDVPPTIKSFKVMTEKGDELLTTAIDKTDYSKFNLRNKKLLVTGEIFDKDSGPDSISWTVREGGKNGIYTAPVGNLANNSGYVTGLSISGDTAVTSSADGKSNKYEIDLSGIVSKTGLYEIGFEVHDAVNNTTEAGFYKFIYDVTPPQKPTVYYSYVKGSNTVVWYKVGGTDLARTKFLNTNTGDLLENTKSGEQFFPISGLTNNTEYEFKLTTEDYAGNESEESVTIKFKAGAGEGDPVYLKSNFANTDNEVLINITKQSNEENEKVTLFKSNTRIIGYVYDISDLKNVKVIDKSDSLFKGTWIDNFPQLRLGNSTSTSNGLETYNNYSSYFSSLADSDEKNSNMTWYLPSQNEMKEIMEKYSVTKIVRDRKYITSTFMNNSKGNNYIVINESNTVDNTYPTSNLYYRLMAKINMK